MTKQTKQLKTFSELSKLAKQEYGVEIFILLEGGVRSSKHVRWVESIDKYFVVNYVDGTEQYLTEHGFYNKTKTNIGEALNKGALYAEM